MGIVTLPNAFTCFNVGGNLGVLLFKNYNCYPGWGVKCKIINDTFSVIYAGFMFVFVIKNKNKRGGVGVSCKIINAVLFLSGLHWTCFPAHMASFI